ncbi:MAG: peptidoglycan-binding protein [Alphaproteobacteria bacterium]
MRIATVTALAGAAMLVALPASAQRPHWHMQFNVPLFAPPPVYVPPPAYYPPPVYAPPPAYVAPPAYVPPPAYVQPPSRPILQHHELVLRIQDELESRGYRPGPDDGVLDLQTVDAIRQYQRDAGLPIDGEATQNLLDHMLYSQPRIVARPGTYSPYPPPGFVPPDSPPTYNSPSYNPPAYNPPAYAPPPQGYTPRPAPGYVPPAYPPPGTGASVPQAAPRPGDPDVAWVQDALRARGYDAGPADGIMGVRTRLAIEAFQRANNLPVDGTISPALITRLRG